jgi:lipoprotein-anchoring transpeptidase ErfK/SrfK
MELVMGKIEFKAVVAALMCLAAGPVMAGNAKLDLKALNAVEFSKPHGRNFSPVILKAQILLDRLRLSPGAIDGRPGDNLKRALAAFEETQGLKGDGVLDEQAWEKLVAADPEPPLMEYRISAEDVKGPFLEKIPKDLEAQAELDRLSYTGPLELLSEKFHMDPDLLKTLNPGRDFDKAGTTIVAAAVEREKPPPGKTEKAASIEVRKAAGEVRVLDKQRKLLAFYPASVGSEDKPAPSGTQKVRTTAKNPVYTYNPDYRFKGVKAKEKLEIKSGPNNPVGTMWIDLTAETFGIHGTAEPERVGKSASHGCVRLTNWDVEDLATMVEKDMPVVFVD